MKNYYQILGLKSLSSIEDIRRAYRKLALEFHPDRGGEEERMKEINGAYDYLMKNKERYDMTLRPPRPELARSGFTITVGGFGWSSNHYTTAQWTVV